MKTKYIAFALVLAASCKDENPSLPDASEGTDSGPQEVVYKQVEHLARPGINEALLFTNDFNTAYNAVAPSFAGADPAAVTAVSNEAKTVLKALYLGACLLNGALGLTAQTGVKPAGITCHAVGAAIWTENALTGVTLTAASQTAAQAYADKVFGQFIPDVMRIDTSGPSGYLTLCADATTAPLLCGGRMLNDDVIDITYNYLLAGAAIPKGPYNQFNALVSDGVNFSSDDSKNSGNTIASTGISNPNQYHPDISSVFPYSAPPF
jgi:hypothetical protein